MHPGNAPAPAPMPWPRHSYPPITVTVSVASNAASQVTNQVSVSGGGSATATASDPTTILAAFADVSSSDAFLPAIDLLREYGITSGCGASPPLYCSTDNITEGQMAVFVVRSVMGGDNFTYTQTPYFSDVPASYLFFPVDSENAGPGNRAPLRAEPVLPGHSR